MIPLHSKLIFYSKLTLAAILPTLFLALIRGLSGTDFYLNALFQTWVLVIGVLIAAPFFQPHADEGNSLQIHFAAIGLIILILGVGICYWKTQNTFLAWVLIGGIYILFLGWVSALTSNRSRWKNLFFETLFTFIAGMTPILITQFETRFSDEEFFVALESIIIMILWVSLRIINRFLQHHRYIPILSKCQIRIKLSWANTGLFLFVIAGSLASINKYQLSFFPPYAPEYPGISSEIPFICGEVNPSQVSYQGAEVFQDLLKQVEDMPDKGIPEYGFLTLGTGEHKWALKFKESLLSEAEAALYTGPVGSLKSAQHYASQRVYYYDRVRNSFPDLFTPTEEQFLADWFSAINQRTFSIEWVDWMYALAFKYWPQGPYENQEAGAGLLSLLESSGLANPGLSTQNRSYLAKNPRGWTNNFRMTDDAAVYQPIWMENAWYQSLYTGEQSEANRDLSFEWLKVLALPDASPLLYNHIGWVQYATSAYWGASLLGDTSQMWLAGRALENFENVTIPIYAQPGMEIPAEIPGYSPTIGSCLVFGNSGLPTQIGPLAPDKVVFRSGWESDDIYLLLNLRFSGWHRYKATNALVQLYNSGPLLIENYSGESFKWLPVGRSLFRDKRIPREYLNGLLIEKTGLSKVLYQLTGIGSPWAQDPPFYAEIEHFETTAEYTVSSTTIQNWHGWEHRRSIYFNPDGIVVIFDDAQGQGDHAAALTWHLVSETTHLNENRLPIGSFNQTADAEVIFLPIDSEKPDIQAVYSSGDLPIVRAQYNSSQTSQLQALTIFLMKDFINANVDLIHTANGMMLEIKTPGQTIELPISKTPPFSK